MPLFTPHFHAKIIIEEFYQIGTNRDSQLNISSYKNYIVNSSKSRNFITSLGKTGAILPVVLLEATVTGGRTYQAYQRDGFVEARERVTEESLAAVFWLFGATMFGKLIEAIGKKTLPLSKEDCDVGKDAVRKPFENMCLEKAKDKTFNKELFAKFKFGKIITSLIAACAFIGFVVPKLNQAITRKFYAHKVEPAKELDERTAKMRARFFHAPQEVNINSVQNFKSLVSDKTPNTQSKAVSFKGAEFFTTMAQNFEQNAIYKLMGTDIGTVSGRAANARNKDEQVEILFRDLSSIYFYCFSTPALLAFMNKKDIFKGANTKLNPNTAMEVHNHFINVMKDEKKTASMPIEEFKKFALGSNEDFDKYYEKFFPNQPEPQPKKILGIFNQKPKKEYRILNLEDYNKIIDANFKGEKAESLKKLGKEMSELQPQLRIAAGDSYKLQSILTESQVEDILKGGEARKPSFMKKMLNTIFSTKKNPDRISDKYVFIPQGEIETAREQILGYVDSISQAAAKDGKKEVDWDVMLKTNKRNIRRNGLYWGVAMGVSSLFLSTIIPKVQYWITKMRTGRDGFPGIENYREQEPKKTA